MRNFTRAVPAIGRKVLVFGAESNGFAEVTSHPDADQHVEVSYFIGPSHAETRRVPVDALRIESLPPQTRCYYSNGNGFRVGRALVAVATNDVISYQVAFPNGKVLLLPETSFHVRSYMRGADPVITLATLAHETPFLFDRRAEWLTRYARQVELSQGLQGLVSSKLELFPHQVEVVRRVLQDPVIRYLLADEVGLGKTVEAGAILRQLRLDSPQIAINVFTPDVLVSQWQGELATRFDLPDANVAPYAAISDFNAAGGIVVIDEAHRVLASASRACVVRATAPEHTPHLLLLSATPVLHHEEQLFDLLNLLDPYAYPVGSFDQFQLRITKRRELGRALLALSRSTRPAFVARHAQRCAELLPDDRYVREIAEACISTPGNDLAQHLLMRHISSLRIHLTETYRIHRRLVRTRRAALITAGDLLQLRHEEQAIYYDDEEKLTELWQTVEEWRMKAAAQVASSADTDYSLWLQLYLEIVQATVDGPASLSQVFASGRCGLSFPGDESVIERIRDISVRIGDDGSRQVVRRFVREYVGEGRWVVFCGTPERCIRFAAVFDKEWDGRIFVVTRGMDSALVTQRLVEFRASDRAVLIGDAVIEEGLNLQFAKGALFVDLPFDPMRLEQRLGRLDRLDRRGSVMCVSALSIEDSTIAFDSAWYSMLTKGFGLLTGSVADQQFLIERHVRELGRAVFEGGPVALLERIAEVAASVESERETAAEQDILDGIDVGDLRESSVWKSLEAADEEEDEFGEALSHYLSDNLGLKVRKGAPSGRRAGSVIQFGLHRHGDPLVPSTMLARVGGFAGRSSTVTRTLAAAEPVLEFLRPGHPLVEELRSLADWDERGQAFALWRKAPGVLDPIFVFTVGIRSLADLSPVQDQLRFLRWDAVGAASLLRLLASWFPPCYYRLLVDAEGSPVDTQLSQLCSRPYDRRYDINLGGERTHALIGLTGEFAWPQMCRTVADEALARVRASAKLISQRRIAQEAAFEHFQLVETRLRLRSQANAESGDSVERMVSQQLVLSKLVEQALGQSSLRIDWFGVHVLSDEAICPR